MGGGAVGLVLGWVVIILIYLDIERRNPGGSAMMELLAIPVIAVATVTGVMIGAAVGRWLGWP